MRRSVSLQLLGILLGTMCACTDGVRGSRPPAVPSLAQGSVVETPVPSVGKPSTERLVNVPSFVGLDLEAASERAHAAGLELMVLRVPGLPAGSVLEQNPGADRLVPEGAPVRVRIASGTASGSVPFTPPAMPSDVATARDGTAAPQPEVTPSIVPEGPVAPVTEAPLPVPSVLDRTEPVARRILSDAGFRVRIEATESGVEGRVMDQLPSPGDRVPRGSEILLKVPGFVPSADAVLGSPDAAPEGTIPSTPPGATAQADPPVPTMPTPPPVAAEPPPVAVEPPADEVPVPIFAGPRSLAGTAPPSAPPAREAPASPTDTVPVPPSDAVPAPPPTPPSSSAESAGEPAGPSMPGLEIPKPKSPPHDSQIPIAPSVSVELSWEPVAGATGYLIEIEELVGPAWTPRERRIVKAAKALAQIEPSQPTATDVRWRVRSVVGRRGGRPAPWVVFHLR